jgi:predicted sulfurtransferase
MKRKYLLFVSGVVFWVFLCAFLASAFAADPPRISKEELQAMLGNPDLALIDDRSDADWTAGEFKIKGAVREEPGKVDAWMGKYSKEKTIVFY